MEPTRKELILAAAVMLLIVIGAEVVLRIAGTTFAPQLYIGDQQRGWVLRAGAEGTTDGETRQFVRINSKGFHDLGRTYQKPANTFRIAVLGNSWTEALQVPLEKTYAAVLERRLQDCACFGDKLVEVLNFGVSGYSTAQELLLIRQEVLRYHPDIILLAFYSARDVANNVRAFNNAANPEQSPYFVYHGDQLVLDDTFRSEAAVQPREICIQKVRTWVNDHVRVLRAVNELVRYRRARAAAAVVRETAREYGVTRDLEHAIYQDPGRVGLEEAWRVTDGLLLAMNDEARAHNSDLVVATLANRPQVIPDPVKRTAFLQAQGLTNLSYADERIKALGLQAGFRVVNLAQPLAAYAEAHHVFLNGFNETNLGEGHWNETGHRVAGEAIAERLCACSAKHGDSLASGR